MANVPAIIVFNEALNEAANSLLSIRDTLHAADVLWPSLTGPVKLAIKAQLQADLDAAQVLVAALQVP